jgi:hypothetical protein
VNILEILERANGHTLLLLFLFVVVMLALLVTLLLLLMMMMLRAILHSVMSDFLPAVTTVVLY